jgi:xanthine dehydrogenase molybdopterin-binding subunit B
VKSLPHDSAVLHVTGKSEFIDDIPSFPNELYVEVVMSAKADAR